MLLHRPLEGTAGAGKTRVNDECAWIAAELSFRVGRGGTESVTHIELGALFDALFEGDSPFGRPPCIAQRPRGPGVRLLASPGP